MSRPAVTPLGSAVGILATMALGVAAGAMLAEGAVLVPWWRAMPPEAFLRWYADNIWLFVPVQEKLKGFLTSLPQYPFQQGSSLNAANINYNSIQAMQAMKRLQQLETLSPPHN